MFSCAYARIFFSWPASSLLTRTAGVGVMTERCGRGSPPRGLGTSRAKHFFRIYDHVPERTRGGKAVRLKNPFRQNGSPKRLRGQACF